MYTERGNVFSSSFSNYSFILFFHSYFLCFCPGIDYTHPDLKRAYASDVDFCDKHWKSKMNWLMSWCGLVKCVLRRQTVDFIAPNCEGKYLCLSTRVSLSLSLSLSPLPPLLSLTFPLYLSLPPPFLSLSLSLSLCPILSFSFFLIFSETFSSPFAWFDEASCFFLRRTRKQVTTTTPTMLTLTRAHLGTISTSKIRCRRYLRNSPRVIPSLVRKSR